MDKFIKYMKESDLHFLSRLPSYTLKSTLIRVFSVILTGVCFLVLATNVTVEMEVELPFHMYVQVILIFIVLSESNVLFDNLAERFFPIPDRIKSRIFMHFLLSVVLGFLSIAYFDRISDFEDLLKQRIVWLLIALGFLFVFILIMFSIGLRIIEKWIWSLKEIDRLKEAKLESDYNLLQDQLNPHFLFNNLSVLKSMIIYDPKSAAVFTQNFTDVYRYVLQSSRKTTVKLAEEMEFIMAYIGIHRERMGEGLHVSTDVSDDVLEKNIPPLALQLLLENAIKHNVASKKTPLHIQIFSQLDTIVVRNKIQLRESSDSTKKGLPNLASRYELLTNRKMDISNDGEIFEVVLPLL